MLSNKVVKSVSSVVTCNKNNYDVDYIKSEKVDFSKIEENHIKDLMLDGHELQHLLTLSSDELDFLLFGEEELEGEDWSCDDDEFFGCLNEEFIPEIPYSEDEEEKISKSDDEYSAYTFANMRKIKDHLKLWDLDFEGLTKWEMYDLYTDNLVLY